VGLRTSPLLHDLFRATHNLTLPAELTDSEFWNTNHINIDIFTLEELDRICAEAADLQKLRETVPAPVLAHYLRLLGIGRNSVALVRRGICSECHIRIPVSTIGSLMKPTDIQVCESCGCYLLLPEDENPLAAQPAKPVAAARRRVRRETAAAT